MAQPTSSIATLIALSSSLDHFEHQLNTVLEGIAGADGERKHIRIALLAGADLIQTMSQPGRRHPLVYTLCDQVADF